MPHAFRGAANPAEIVGRTPWSARVPLDPLLANEISASQTARADEGVGCGPGVRPTINADCAVLGKVRGSTVESPLQTIENTWQMFRWVFIPIGGPQAHEDRQDCLPHRLLDTSRKTGMFIS